MKTTSTYQVYPIIFALMIISSLISPTWAYPGGDGSWQNPYQLSIPEDLICLGYDLDNYDKCFILMNDIDLSGYSFYQAVIASPYHLEDYEGDGFDGLILGDGHVISHLTISGDSNVGLIGTLGTYGRIHGLGLVDATIAASQNRAGMLVGLNQGTISQCFGSGTVQGHVYVGGLVGSHESGCITDCYSLGEIQGELFLGGLVGGNVVSDIVNCYSACILGGEAVNDGIPVYGLSDWHALASFWDSQVSGITGDYGLSTEQMMDANTFIDAGWDFLNESGNGGYDIWKAPATEGYPVLSLFNGHQAPWPHDEGVMWGMATLSEDPNQVLWNSPDVFLPEWQRVSVNQVIHGSDDKETTLKLSGTLTVLDSNNLVALDPEHAIPCQAFDEQGALIDLQNRLPVCEPSHHWVVLPTHPVEFELVLRQIDSTRLSTVDALTYALYAQSLIQMDLPLEVTADWITLVPGFRVKIDQVDIAGGICEYTIQESIDANGFSFGGLTENATPQATNRGFHFFWADSDVVYARQFINNQGNLINVTTLSGSSRHSEGKSISTLQVRIAQEDIGFVHYNIAIQPYSVLVPFTLENIPLPK